MSVNRAANNQSVLTDSMDSKLQTNRVNSAVFKTLLLSIIGIFLLASYIHHIIE